jgi:hypothetical protein
MDTVALSRLTDPGDQPKPGVEFAAVRKDDLIFSLAQAGSE